jgi:hypothetical protein
MTETSPRDEAKDEAGDEKKGNKKRGSKNKREKGKPRRRMSTEAQDRLDKWNAKRNKQLDKNKTVRRLSGESEHGNWATIVKVDAVDISSEKMVDTMEQASASRSRSRYASGDEAD